MRTGKPNGIRYPGLIACSGSLVVALFSWCCEGCRSERPYTPFKIDSTPSSVPSATPITAALDAGTATSAQPPAATRIDPPARRITVGPNTLDVPENQYAELRLDSAASPVTALVWSRPAAPPDAAASVGGTLWRLSPNEPARRLVDVPGFLPTAPSCTLAADLTRTGSTTVTLDLRTRCDDQRSGRDPGRALMILSPESASPLVLGLRAAEPATGETLTLGVSSTDRDGDGRDDVNLTVELGVTSTEKRATTQLGWLDRAAGASFEAGTLVSSLEPQLARLESRANRRERMQETLESVDAVLRLLGSVCGETGTNRLWRWEGQTLDCRDLSALHGRLARIQQKAILVGGTPLEATGMLVRTDRSLGGLETAARQRLEQQIVKAGEVIEVQQTRSLPVRLAPTPGTPHYGPLRFDRAGNLWYLTETEGVAGVAPDGHPLAADAGAPEPWSMTVRAPDGRFLDTLIEACNRSEVLFVIRTPNQSRLAFEPTRLLAARPGNCSGAVTRPINVQPIGWTDAAPQAILDGVCVLGNSREPCPAPESLGPVVPGSPRSEDGRLLISPTRLGVWIIRQPRPELWRGPGLGNPERLRDCAVANRAASIACLTPEGILLVPRPGSSPKPD